jgi:hypothetical protein
MATLGGSTEVEYTQNSVEIDNLAIFAVQEHNIKQVFFTISILFCPVFCLLDNVFCLTSFLCKI